MLRAEKVLVFIVVPHAKPYQRLVKHQKTRTSIFSFRERKKFYRLIYVIGVVECEARKLGVRKNVIVQMYGSNLFRINLSKMLSKKALKFIG